MSVEKSGPVEPEYIEQMHSIMTVLDELFNPPGLPKQTGVTLLIFPFGDGQNGERINYMSNANRKDMIASMRELLAKWEGRTIEEVKTKQ